MILRPYQAEMENQIYKAWKEGAKNIMAQLSTGAGKTVLLAKIIASCNEPSLVIAHRVEIVSQISLTLAKHGIRHNIIAQKPAIREIVSLHMLELKCSYYDPQSKFAVAGVDTLLRMDENTSWFKKVQLLVQDEGHHVLKNNKWGRAAELFPNARGLYPTATPVRADGRGLGRHADGIMDHLIVGVPMRELIRSGYLTEYRVISPPNNLDLSEVSLSAGGDYSPPKLRKAVHKSKITGDVVENYLKFAEGKQGVTFAVDLEAASEITREYKSQGVCAEMVSSKTPELLRASIMRRFRAGEIMQIVNVDLLGEGVDVPAISVVSFARPTASICLFYQQFGRALRPMPGKTHAIIIDHVGNVFRHRLPDDLKRKWSLDRAERRSRKPMDDAIKVKICLNPRCMAVYACTHSKCPICGHYSPPAARGSPEQVDGDLTELSPDVLAILRGEIDRIDGAPRIPPHLDQIAQRGISNKHKERQSAQKDLRHNISVWAGIFKSQGLNDAELYRKFYFDFGIDIATAQTLKVKDANELKNHIDTAISKD